MSDALTAREATFLELEERSDGAVLNVGGVMVFDPSPDGAVPTVPAVTALVEDRLAGLPRFRQRLSDERTGAWSWPGWIDDERFATLNHVRHAALPAPGGDAELCDWIADYYSHRLDRTRPLWEMVLLEDLERGRWALAYKVHHCLVDGVGPVGVPELLLDARPATGNEVDGAACLAEPEPSLWRSLVRDPPPPVAQATKAGAHAVASGLRATLHPRETLARSRTVAELIIKDELIGAPHTSLNDAIGSTRRYAAVRCRLVDLMAIRDELGGSLNEVALAACTAGLRRVLLERGEQLPVDGLRAMVPVELANGSLGLRPDNRIGSLFVGLPVAEPGVVVRHRQIVRSTQTQRSSRAGEASSTLVDLASLAPPLVHAAIARVLYGPRLFNLSITNLRGANAPRYAFECKLREVHPVVPLAAGHAVAIATFSHDGRLTFGLSADCESMSDLEILADGIAEGIEDLLAAASHGARAAHAQPMSTR
jgi:diacylglycerol O-acyltransferase / wax synthase